MSPLPDLDDTIVARATADGEGGVAVVRISGKAALSVLEAVFVPKHEPNWSWGRMHFGMVVDPTNGEAIDEALAVFFPAPNSYTGQNSAELHVHGSHAVVSRVLDATIAAGARMAQPGEFTFRAFASGRLDLTSAEAVADLVSATSDSARRNALRMLQGTLYEQAMRLRQRLLAAAAEIEAHLDFPEEDIEPGTASTIRSWIQEVRSACMELASTFKAGKALQGGVRIVIAGAPNAGKSSLMNRLLGFERAITSPTPGTTRDFLTERIVIDGMPIELADTAGLRTGEDSIERQGVQLAYKLIKESDFVLVLKDASQPFGEEDLQAVRLLETHAGILVLNKMDLLPNEHEVLLPDEAKAFDTVKISCKQNWGITRLQEQIAKYVRKLAPVGEGVLITRERQFDALMRAVAELDEANALLDSAEALDLAALYVRSAIAALSDLIGETTPEDVLEDIFSRFCVGK